MTAVCLVTDFVLDILVENFSVTQPLDTNASGCFLR